jgi:CO/xanthine dehydrogenase Mo-binding subunit
MPINTGTETATVLIDPSGSVTAMFGIASHGQGLETSLAKSLRRSSEFRSTPCACFMAIPRSR